MRLFQYFKPRRDLKRMLNTALPKIEYKADPDLKKLANDKKPDMKFDPNEPKESQASIKASKARISRQKAKVTIKPSPKLQSGKTAIKKPNREGKVIVSGKKHKVPELCRYLLAC